jgi:hypothetical protein
MRHLFLVLLLSALWPAQALAEKIYVHSQHPKSLRIAVLDDDEKVAYLYLMRPSSDRPERDAVAYSRVPLVAKVDWQQVKKTGVPPPLSADVASRQAIVAAPEAKEFSFLWSADGHSVALLRNGEPIALATMRDRLGFSKAVAKTGRLANAWNQKRYVELMGMQP